MVGEKPPSGANVSDIAAGFHQSPVLDFAGTETATAIVFGPTKMSLSPTLKARASLDTFQKVLSTAGAR